MTRVLITGGTGLLGKTLLETRPEGPEIFSTHLRAETAGLAPCTHFQLDITRTADVARVFATVRPDVVIHAAASGSVDFAEREPEAARAISVGGTQAVIDACNQHRAKLIYISSNAVFRGDAPPYREDAARDPINHYGVLKRDAEDCVVAAGIPFAIVRPILFFGWNHAQGRKNPVTLWLSSLQRGLPIEVVEDRFWQPLFVEDCAQAIWRIVERDQLGAFHVAGPTRMSLFELALQTAEVFGLNPGLIHPVPSSHFPQIAPRPVDTSMNIERLRAVLGVVPREPRAGLLVMRDRHSAQTAKAEAGTAATR